MARRSQQYALLVAACTILLMFTVPSARAAGRSGLYDGSTGRAVSLEHALEQVRGGWIVIVSEEHDVEHHHVNQLAVLMVLRRLNLPVSVGFEFLAYPDQPWVDRYVRDEIQEPEFLRAVRWGGYPFDWYRSLLLFPREAGGSARALNAPQHLATALAHKGVGGLSADERALLPPDFQLGNARYLERFTRDVRQHGGLSEADVQNFFAAQSAWDDTMAWQALEYVRGHPDQVLVIIVGDFHAAYGGGLPDRLRARGAANVLVLSQVNGYGLSDVEVQQALAPDPRYGVRADFVWLTHEAPRDAHGGS